MRPSKYFLNLVFILTLALSSLGSTTTSASAENDNNELKADPRLLLMAEENPDAIFMIIVQKDAQNKDLKDMEVEDEVLKGGGQVKKQLDLIVSFSAEITGKEIIKLARHPKVRWISADAPMVSTAADMSASSVAMAAPAAAVGTTYTVTSTSNSGTGTLRQAITDANNHAGADTISFNISGSGVRSITVSTALPTITSPVVMDGWSNPGYTSTPVIELNGGNLGTLVKGLVLGAGSDGSTIRGLIINRFTGTGIEISGSSNHTIQGNWIGLNSTGTAASANGVNGIYALNSTGNLIGGITAATRNVISGNSNQGIYFDNTDSSTISGNYIGTNVAGTGDVNGTTANTYLSGIYLTNGSSNNIVGGTTAVARNVISGNNHYGFEIVGATSQNNLLQGNYIGTTASGLAKLPNVNGGASFWGAGTGNVFGGLAPGAGNVISGNSAYGVLVGNGSSGATVQGNYIGLDAAGTGSLGNSSHGVIVDSTSSATIGGTAPGAGNWIAFNNAGIYVASGTGNAILGNKVYSNTGLGIDLGSSGVTANDGAKISGQPNLLMDFPVIVSATFSSCGLTVTGYVGSAANQAAFAYTRVEVFKSSNDTNGYGEGQTLLGSLTADSNGNFAGNLPAAGIVAGDRLTATATDTNNNTSEFGLNFQVPNTTGSCYYSAFLSAVKADKVSLQGSGVTVAVVDSGISTMHPDFISNGSSRVIAGERFGNNMTTEDAYGHGSHVAGIIGGNGTASGGLYRGIAPGVNLINLKTSDANGMTYESSVVEALQWIYNNKASYNIKIVNISMNSTVAQSYHTSPLDAAVEILWFNGITVVVSAGNNGTANGPSTLHPPANDPFVITVGAAEDKGTASLGDDTMGTFSAYGITESGFAKPDLVAPGRNLVAPLGGFMNSIFNAHSLNRVNDYYFRMSGTSMSAPVVSGAVALLLQDEPGLTPDQVKYRLTATAVNRNRTWPSYDAAKAGAGYLDIYSAVNGNTQQSANTGIVVSNMLTTGTNPVTWGSVGWNSVGWNSVGWNSVGWNSVGWNSVGWNSVVWTATLWDN